MEKQFEGKVAIVTGGTFGIGRSTAIAFAKAGANVIVADVFDGKEVVEKIIKSGGKATYIKCDVSSAADVKNLIDQTIAKYGRLDVAYNNAGIEGIAGNITEIKEEDWNHTIDVNLKSIWLCMKYEIPEMLKVGMGSIVNCASIAGLVGFPNLSPYTASKHGVIGLTKTAALEYAKQNIRVNAVCPGVIKTPMIDRFTGNNKEVEQQFASQEPIGRLGQPEEVAGAVLWLCSEASSFVTGHALAVDGGWVTQ